VAATDAERQRYFDSLFTEHVVGIASYCRWRADSPSDAQDAVSEVFLVAWRRLDEVAHTDARRWLYATARRVIANQARANARRSKLQETLDAERIGAPPTNEDLVGSQVMEALAALGAGDREVLLLTEWEGLTPAEIAAVVRRPAVTVRGRLHRARRRFRAAFEALQTDSAASGTPPGDSLRHRPRPKGALVTARPPEGATSCRRTQV
jgi:RNA polymerase sigma factor (sigma-70 family)